MTEETISEPKILSAFVQREEYEARQNEFLELELSDEPSDEAEDKREIQALRQLTIVLDHYQEQSYLLDPYLESLLVPVIDRFRAHAKALVSGSTKASSSARLWRLSHLIYAYVKFRGYKTIVRFFPHEIADVSVALGFMEVANGTMGGAGNWPVRYVVLLWISLVCRIPFDLAQFDELDRIGETSRKIECLGRENLSKAGLERDGAALLLSRLYMRKDTADMFDEFIRWSDDTLRDNSDIFLSIGILQVLCEVSKSGPSVQVRNKAPAFLKIANTLEGNASLVANNLARKFKTKLVARVALRILPPSRGRANFRRVRTLAGDVGEPVHPEHETEFEPPEEIEGILEELFKALKDKDTIVRWSAAKSIARISERLPPSYAEQLLDAVLFLFKTHSVATASLYDLPAVAESTWHGACLGCAEIARRGLVDETHLSELVEWLSKALYFDIRKGAHSIGSNVRDAAAYVLWALARAQDVSSMRPHAGNMARRLVTVALFDREIHIRRAASAAFQEHVGRLSLFPHGIDVLGKTDFYVVSVRRTAFLVAAPQVAVHPEYRQFLFDHLIDVTLRHWDQTMRELGAQALGKICGLDMGSLGPKAVERVSKLFESVDVNDAHGGFLALTELVKAYKASSLDDELICTRVQGIFNCLSAVSKDIVMTPRNKIVTSAACELIASSISSASLSSSSDLSASTYWWTLIEFGLKHRDDGVQESASNAMREVSRLVECSSVMKSLTKEMKTGPRSWQRSLARLLGVLDYEAYPHDLDNAVENLLGFVSPKSGVMLVDIEARRNCYQAMPRILSTVASSLSKHLTPRTVQSMFDALLAGLDDYTLDERGDIGSWVRISCIRGVTQFIEVLMTNAFTLRELEAYISFDKFHRAIGMVLKQGMERLDNVRQEAGESLMGLLRLPRSDELAGSYRFEGEELMKQLLLSGEDNPGWGDGAWLFPKAVKLLEIEKYRPFVLTGLVVSIGSKTDSTKKPVSLSLAAYVQSLPLQASSETTYAVQTLVDDLVKYMKDNLQLNGVVVPVLQTFNVLLNLECLESLSEMPKGCSSLRELLSIALKNVARLKNVQRIHESMKIVVNLLVMPSLRAECTPLLSEFLIHQYPKVRADSAEFIYFALQSKDIGIETDEIENILLETQWSLDFEAATLAAKQIVGLFASV